MDKGVLVEEGKPIDLIEKKGEFYDMISKNGRKFIEEMTKLASKKRNS